MKNIFIIMLFLLLTGCGYTMKLGLKCTPGHDEWSYVWFIEKEGTNVNRNNCEKLAK
tara:strand:+ start:955 stop:1125 length:171 start_codon:yes stop_codon:yes gene_type:complete